VKVLLIDIETTPNLAHVWGLWNQNVGLNQLLEATEMFSFAAKWLDGKKTQFFSTFHDGKEQMVQAAWNYLNEADVVVGWNSKAFDVKHLNREFLLAGMQPPSPFKQVDLLLEVRKVFKFPSNKLQYVSTILGYEGKVSHSGHQLWIDCLAGDAKAWAKMRTYNKQDVDLLEPLYLQLRPWISTPNPALYGDTDEHACPACGSEDFTRQGYAFTKLGQFQRYLCSSPKCGKWFRGGTRVAAVDLREVA
jgi:hypothetical protein